jgi:uncharacterized protein YacL
MIVYPGETMHVTVIKEGKENGQGVGYLEDGNHGSGGSAQQHK